MAAVGKQQRAEDGRRPPRAVGAERVPQPTTKQPEDDSRAATTATHSATKPSRGGATKTPRAAARISEASAPAPSRAPTPAGKPRGRVDRQQRKEELLTHGSSSVVASIADAVVIKQGEPFFLCPPNGQIDTSGEHGYGLYHHDTRFLSGYEVRIAGLELDSLAATAVTGAEAMLELTNPLLKLDEGRTFAKERLGIRWRRRLDDAPPRLVDRITIRSYAAQAARIPLRFSFGADFRDVFAVRGLLPVRPGNLRDPRWTGHGFELRYDGQDGVRRTVAVTIHPTLAEHDGSSGELTLDIPAYGVRSVEIKIAIREQLARGAPPIEERARDGGRETAESRARRAGTEGSHPGEDPSWSTSVTSSSLALELVLGRSLTDLLTLRDVLGGQRYYAAGVPWFSTLFGRDALITAYQTLAFEPAVAAETLRLLAIRQGSADDAWRDEEPGRILHELRVGELARLHEIPHTPYYGSIDSTPLFLVLLARHAAWTGDLDLFRELREHVDQALAWLDRCAARSRHGYLAYDSTTKHGLVNQGWKDSGDAIVRADGSTADPPIALAEVQGYVHAAKREIAELFERDGDRDRAARLRHEADELRDRFERDFWSEQLGCYVLALAADGRPCNVLTSNAGQVLWSGIAAADRAATVAHRLLSDEMFSGWGIRTLSERARAYNPVGYHLGTVWPHDNGLIADGFRRYALDDAAERILNALVAAAQDFPQARLPECFAGFSRSAFGTPVRYPIACHPQAWAAGAVPHLLTISLGLSPEAFEQRLRIVRPRLPAWASHVELHGLRVGQARVDLSFDRTNGATTVAVGHTDGELDVRVETS